MQKKFFLTAYTVKQVYFRNWRRGIFQMQRNYTLFHTNFERLEKIFEIDCNTNIIVWSSSPN